MVSATTTPALTEARRARRLAALSCALAACAGCAGGAGSPDGGGADTGTDDTDTDDTDPDWVVWPNAESFANSDPWLPEHHAEIDQLRPRVLALNFVNARTMAEMEAQLEEMIEVVTESSCHHGCGDPEHMGSPPALVYELAYQVDLRDADPPDDWPYNNSTLYPREDPVQGVWGFDYGRLFSEEFADLYAVEDPDEPSHVLDLCELFDRGLVHEVWVYGDADVPDVSAAEILELKPYYDEDRVRIPGPLNRCAGNGCFDAEDAIPCDRTVRIAWFNNTRGPGCFLESLSHGFESTGAWNAAQIPYLSRYFVPFASYDLDTRYGLPFDSWYACDAPGCLSYPDATSVTWQIGDEGGSIDPYDPVCGNVHFMPNGTGHYDLVSPFDVETSCRHFRDGSGETELFTIERFAEFAELAPDCMGPFLVWWRQSFPGPEGEALDDDDQPMLSFWPFIYY